MPTSLFRTSLVPVVITRVVLWLQMIVKKLKTTLENGRNVTYKFQRRQRRCAMLTAE